MSVKFQSAGIYYIHVHISAQRQTDGSRLGRSRLGYIWQLVEVDSLGIVGCLSCQALHHTILWLFWGMYIGRILR